MKPDRPKGSLSAKAKAGREEKARSWALKAAAAEAAEERRRRRRREGPRRRKRSGPCLEERAWKDLWSDGVRRWRWPIRGMDGGLGGRWRWVVLVVFLVKKVKIDVRMKGEMRRRKRRMRKIERGSVSNMVDLFVTVMMENYLYTSERNFFLLYVVFKHWMPKSIKEIRY